MVSLMLWPLYPSVKNDDTRQKAGWVTWHKSRISLSLTGIESPPHPAVHESFLVTDLFHSNQRGYTVQLCKNPTDA
jgi:hypothetical protein